MKKIKHYFLFLLLISTISIYGGIGVGESQEGPTPVELISFSLTLNDGSVLLNWATATEVNNYGFAVERKVQNQKLDDIWEKIGFVEGHGNSNSPKEYSFLDDNKFVSQFCCYRLKQIDTDGAYKYSRIIEINNNGIHKSTLLQNYPNPFNPTTIISYNINEPSYLQLKVYDVLGNEICTLVDEHKNIGSYQLKFDASELSNGIYFYKLSAGSFTEIKKMMLIK